MHFSLVSGWFLPAIVTSALGCLAGAVGWRDRRWRRTLPLVAAVSTAITAGLWWYVTSRQLIQPALPAKAWGWVLAVVFALLAVAAGWRRANLRQRLLGPPALLLTTLMTAALFNAYYAYFPTMESLVGSPTAHQVSAHQIAVQVATPGVRDYSHLTLYAHLPTHGVTYRVPIPGTVSGFSPRSAWIYLPPAWFARPRPHLPVVMLLEGTPSDPVDWFRAGLADRTADVFASQHHGLAPILVLPDENGSFEGDTECVNRVGANAETYLAVDVRRYVVTHLGAARNPSAWAVAGLSEGGTCAFDLTLRHTNLFRAFGDFSGDPVPFLLPTSRTLPVLFHGDRRWQAHYAPSYLLAHRPRRRRVAGWFEAGRGDRWRTFEEHLLARAAARSGIVTGWRTVPGPHNFVVWGESFASALQFFWPNFRAPGLVNGAAAAAPLHRSQVASAPPRSRRSRTGARAPSA